MFPTKPRAPIQDTQVLNKLNAAAVGIPKTEWIPSNLLTLEEAEKRVMIDGLPIAHNRLLRWINKAHATLPHYRFSSHCVRIPADLFDTWIAELFENKKRRVRKSV